MLLIIDHYDSFSAMIADYCQGLCAELLMIKTDQVSTSTLTKYKPTHLIIGPGPGHPSASELVATKQLIHEAIAKQIPILGICLGHQLIGEIYGAQVIPARYICHGIVAEIENTQLNLFEGLPSKFKVTRYHSLIIESQSILATELMVSATTSQDEIMAFYHPFQAVFGVQFHPESVSSEFGHALLANFLKL